MVNIGLAIWLHGRSRDDFAVVRRPTNVVLLAGAAVLVIALQSAQAVNITVSAGVAGKTPEIVGYNSGHFMPGSNTADWWRYSGMNGARVWPTPSTVEGSDDNGVWGDGVNSQSSFLARRAALRADPLNTTYINWPYFQNRYQNNPTDGANIIALHYGFGELRKLGIDPVVEINRTNSTPWGAAGTAAGWADRWEQWQHFYAQAFYLARNFGVQRFQMYNEPNLDDIPITQYIERLQFASDAVQSAVADVNELFGQSLDPQMQAPVSAGGTSAYSAWGKPVMQSLHTNFLGTTDPNFKLIDTYAYQQYNMTGESFGSQLANIKNLVAGDAPGQSMRFAITEFSVHTAAVFDGLTETLDTPSKSSRFGSILANLANNRPDELYIFKFSQGPGSNPGTIKKNGTHFVDNDSAPYNIGGVTKGGEVARLFAKGFAGAHELLSVPAASGAGATDLRLAAAHNAAEDRHYLFSANEATAERTLSINVSRWGIEAGARVVVEEVSADRHGEVSHFLSVPPGGVLNLTQPAQSVLLLSLPKAAPAYQVTLDATDDAMVKAGSNAGVNFGDNPSVFANNDAIDPAARSVSFVKFNTGSIVSSEIEQAILQVRGKNTGSASQVIAHVYGLTNDQWSESTIHWNNAPNLASSAGPANDISHNFIEGIGETAHIVGHFTGTAAERQLSLDVTQFVRDHPNQEITFLIVREVRFDGENVDAALTSLQLASKERGSEPGPQLLLSLSSYALPGDYDHNGVVDAADYGVWRKDFGSTAEPAADGNRDGTVDAADYIVWRRNVGTSLPGLTPPPAATFAVPEPSCATLAWLGTFSFGWFALGR